MVSHVALWPSHLHIHTCSRYCIATFPMLPIDTSDVVSDTYWAS